MPPPPPALPRTTLQSTHDKTQHMFLFRLACKNTKTLKDASVADIKLSGNNYQLYLFGILLSHKGLDNFADTFCSRKNQGRDNAIYWSNMESHWGSLKPTQPLVWGVVGLLFISVFLCCFFFFPSFLCVADMTQFIFFPPLWHGQAHFSLSKYTEYTALVCSNCQLSGQEKERGAGYREGSITACHEEQTKSILFQTFALWLCYWWALQEC